MQLQFLPVPKPAAQNSAAGKPGGGLLPEPAAPRALALVVAALALAALVFVARGQAPPGQVPREWALPGRELLGRVLAVDCLMGWAGHPSRVQQVPGLGPVQTRPGLRTGWERIPLEPERMPERELPAGWLGAEELRQPGPGPRWIRGDLNPQGCAGQ